MKEAKINLVWNDENECAMTAASGVSREDFFEAVKTEAKEMEMEIETSDISLNDIDLVPMIAIEETLYGDQIMPLVGSGIIIENYWVIEF
jgi:hypothetical protein